MFYGESSLPFTAALLFRVGRADESLQNAGITHLVEHLSLPVETVPGVTFNGVVNGTTTLFWAEGPRDRALAFLGGTAARLGDLPLERLEQERSILLTEAAGSGWDSVRASASLRFGPNGYGLIGFDELGLYRLQRDEVAAWARKRFTRSSVALCVTGEPPAELDLPLPEGTRHDLPEPAPIPYLRLPSVFPNGGSGRVSVAFVAPRTTAFSMVVGIAAESIKSRVRHRAGVTYQVDSYYDPISPELAHVVVWADCLDENADSVRNGLLTALDDIAEHEPTAEELEHEVEATRRMHQDPSALTSGLLYHAAWELFGGEFQTDEEYLAERESTTAAQAAEALASALESSLLIVPDGASTPAGRFHPYPVRSPADVPGRRFKPRGIRLPGRSTNDLVAGEEGVAFEGDGFRNAVRFDQCAAVMRWDTGARGLWSTDGYYVFVDPGEWRRGKGLTELIDRHVGRERAIPMDAVTLGVSDEDLLQGLALANDGEAAQAIPLFQAGLEREPKAGLAWATLALCLSQERRFGEALRAADRAVELEPKLELSHRMRAYALWYTGQREAGVEAVRRALELEPAEAQTLSDFAWFLADGAHYGEARRAANRAVELHPEDAASWFARGWAAVLEGRFEAAEPDLRKAIELQPRDSMWHNNLGWLLLQTARTKEALAAFEKALSLDRSNVTAGLNRGLALALSGRDRDAQAARRKLSEAELERLERLLASDPDDADLRSSRAHRLHELGRHEEALADAREAARRATHVVPLLNLVGWLGDEGLLEEAHTTWREVAEREPDNQSTLYYRAWLGAVAGEAEPAEEAARAALARNEDDRNAWAAAGYAALAAGRWEEARDWFDRILERDRLFCCAHVWKGVAEARLGNTGAARALLDRTLRISPTCRCAGVVRLEDEVGRASR